jgi:hypothetical protein
VVAAALVAVLVACSGAGATSQAQPGGATAIFERAYIVASLSTRSGDESLEADRLAFSFGRGLDPANGYDYSVSWTLHCNLFGAEMKVGPRRLWFKVNFQTEVGCPPQGQREDDWVVAFLEADPYWEVGRRGILTLSTPLEVMSLRPGRLKRPTVEDPLA